MHLLRWTARGAVAAAAAVLVALTAAGTASAAAVPVTTVTLPYGPGGLAAGYLGLDVLGQSMTPGTPVVAWQSNEYQDVQGVTDPAEQFELVPVTFTPSVTGSAATTVTGTYQIQWAPGGVASGLCVSSIGPADRTWARTEKCAVSQQVTAATLAASGGTAGTQAGTLSGNQWQDFDVVTGTTDFGTAYGMLEPLTTAMTGAFSGLTYTAATGTAAATAAPAASGVALNDSAYRDGGHVIDWTAVSSQNEEFTAVTGGTAW